MLIRVDDLRGPQIQRLLQEHLQSMTLYAPAGSIHAFDLDELRRPEVTFWSAWDEGELLGCGARVVCELRLWLLRAVRAVRSRSLQRVHDARLLRARSGL